MIIPSYYMVPPLPDGLEGLAGLALDLRWSWSHATDPLWQRIDSEVWTLTRNPWLILQTVSGSRLKELAADPGFRQRLAEHETARSEWANRVNWFQSRYPRSPLQVAYFSMEFGLSEALPLYSGGLGILAGDYLKTAADLGVPVVGVGLLYQQGYFRQTLDAGGAQKELFPYNDPGQLPILPVRRPDGEWLRLDLDFPGRKLKLRAWQAEVGDVTLYLLDSNDAVNSPADQGITSELYGGGPELRLQQEIVLGIGGWRLLEALGVSPQVCHLNEGHAALAVLERVRTLMTGSGLSFNAALAASRAGNIFTTHTPVEAGFDRFSTRLIEQYLGGYTAELGIGLRDLLALGRREPADDQEPFNMAYLAVHASGMVNGVSRLHGEVSRRIFQPLFERWPRAELPIGHVTNGVHVPSWDSPAADALWSSTCGKARWLGTMETLEEDLKQVPDETLWKFRCDCRLQLVRYVRGRLTRQLAEQGAAAQDVKEARQTLDPQALTLGFARRFAVYKRPNLLLRDPERLIALLCRPDRPVQLIVAGKAHPRDEAGKEMIRSWSAFIRHPEVKKRVVFLADYDMALAEQMVQGVDVWINTPRRPWEACGTSGMKILVNGGLNLSELDGWWAEAFADGVGWSLGDGLEHGDDPAWDAREADQLYQTLETQVISYFYKRSTDGIPQQWVSYMRRSMAELTPRFSSNRMLREYVELLYLPAYDAFAERAAREGETASRLCRWQESIRSHWTRLRFGALNVREEEGSYHFVVEVDLGGLAPDAVKVQLFAESQDDTTSPEIHEMSCDEAGSEGGDMRLYRAVVATGRPADHYTPRVIPHFPGAAIPLEAPQILWGR
jgi:starch phosphorylase